MINVNEFKEQQEEFEKKKAFHALEVARNDMSEAYKDMEKLRNIQDNDWQEVNRLQGEYEEELEAQRRAWEDYNNSQLAMKGDIAQKIASIEECNRLEVEFANLAEATPELAEVHSAVSNFAAKLAKEKLVERDELIAKKRSMPRPDDSIAQTKLGKLKLARAKHQESRERYHHTKNVYTLKREEYDRLAEKYRALTSPDNTTTNTYSSCPKPLLDNEKLSKLKEAGIPQEYWEDAEVEQRANQTVDIYYARSLGEGHGHVVIDANSKIVYHRSPSSANRNFIVHNCAS